LQGFNLNLTRKGNLNPHGARPVHLIITSLAAFIGAFSLPVLYVKNQKLVDDKVSLLKDKLDELIEKVLPPSDVVFGRDGPNARLILSGKGPSPILNLLVDKSGKHCSVATPPTGGTGT